MVTLEDLFFICGAKMKKEVAEAFLHHLPQACYDYEINTPERLAHFIAQVAHESANFVYREEIASGAAYEGRRDLGNTQPGDGRRFKGRSFIQLTGRANYRQAGNELGWDLENNPQLVSSNDEVGIYATVWYWYSRKINDSIDSAKNLDDAIRKVTKKINGGYNGLNDRIAKTKRAMQIKDRMFDGFFDNVDKSELPEE